MRIGLGIGLGMMHGSNPPAVPSLTAPTSSTVWVYVGQNVTVSATSTDGDLDEMRWVVSDGSETEVASDATSPYSTTWVVAEAVGEYTIVARAVRNGLTTDSAPLTIYVIPAPVIQGRADQGVTKDGSDLVSSWVFTGSVGLTFTAAGGARPTWKSAEIGGRDTIRGDGASDVMGSTGTLDLSAATGLTWFSVAKDTSVDGDISFEISADAGSNPGMIVLPNAGGAPGFGCYANGGTLRTATIASADHASPTIMCITIDSTQTGPSQIQFYKNGGNAINHSADTGADTTSGFGNDNVYLFARVGAVAPWPGDFAALLLFDSALSTGDRAVVTAALSAYSGIAVT